MAGPVRPRRVVVIAGTATDVGKTWVGARLAEALIERNLTVGARKPAQSFAPDAEPTDADVLGRATGEPPSVVCPEHRWYAVPMAPPMAAEVLGHEPIVVGDLAAEVRESWPGRALDVGLVELAGGPRSPIAHDGDGAQLSALLVPDVVVLVADAGLGTVNAVRQSIRDFPGTGVVVLLNRFDESDELHRRNRDWLAGTDALDVVTEVDGLVGFLLDQMPTFCVWCGRPAAECPGRCSPPFDPPRHCPRCGRRLAVTIIPTGVSARCRDHGPVEIAEP